MRITVNYLAMAAVLSAANVLISQSAHASELPPAAVSSAAGSTDCAGGTVIWPDQTGKFPGNKAASAAIMAPGSVAAEALAHGAVWQKSAVCQVIDSPTKVDGNVPTSKPASTTSSPSAGGTVVASGTITNWAGYIAYPASPNHVSATITLKPPSGFSGDRATSWIGLGNAPLLQAGVIYENNANNTINFKHFWEIVPGYAVQVVSFPGAWNNNTKYDVSYSGGIATFTFYDPVVATTLTVQKASSAPSNQVECISERLQVGSGLAPLSNFGTQPFYNCNYQRSGVSSTYSVPLNGTLYNCVAGGITYMTTQAFSGSNFSIQWNHR